jgi:MFS family permease
MATLDSGVLNMALPTLTRHFDTSLTEAKWVLAIYSLVATLFLLPIGMLSDRWGRKKLYVTGLGIFLFGSCGSLCASSLFMLISSRGLQGLGASMMMTNSPIILARDFYPSERAFALGVLNMMVQAGLLMGPVLASIILTSTHWRLVFALSIPLALLGLALSHYGLPNDPSFEKNKTKKPPLDMWGALLQVLFVLLVLQAIEPSLLGRGTALLLALLCLHVFIHQEKKHPKPLLNFKIFKRRVYMIGNGIGFWMFLPLAMLNALTPSFLEQLGFSTLRAGSLFALFPLFALITAPFSGKWSMHHTPRLLTFYGCLGSGTLFFFWALLLHLEHVEWYTHAISLAALGVAYGLFLAPNNHVIIGAMPEQEAGMSAAVMAVIRNLALTLGAQHSPLLYAHTNMEVCLSVAGLCACFAASFHLLSTQTRGSHSI